MAVETNLDHKEENANIPTLQSVLLMDLHQAYHLSLISLLKLKIVMWIQKDDLKNNFFDRELTARGPYNQYVGIKFFGIFAM